MYIALQELAELHLLFLYIFAFLKESNNGEIHIMLLNLWKLFMLIVIQMWELHREL